MALMTQSKDLMVSVVTPREDISGLIESNDMRTTSVGKPLDAFFSQSLYSSGLKTTSSFP
jgi:hypothetical protein